MFQINGYEITLTRGDSAEFNIELLNADGNSYDIQESDTIEFTVKKNVYSTNTLIHKVGSHITIEPHDTTGMSYGDYVYDVQVTFGDGSVDTVIPPSRFRIMSEVTF